MREETYSFCPSYVRRRIVIHQQEELLSLTKNSAAMLVMLHYGSWILAGGAIARQTGLRYTVIASRRNLDTLNDTDRHFWDGVHRRGAELYGNELFYTDESPMRVLRWLKVTGNVLGVVLDVRETDRPQKEFALRLLGRQITMQTGPARLAEIARVPMIPMVIQYHPDERRHHLNLLPAIFPHGNPGAATQQALDLIEPFVAAMPEQQFYDIATAFSLATPGRNECGLL
jgi:lauroyl/myristoyl acyltransferase